jgi:hypothetical protein
MNITYEGIEEDVPGKPGLITIRRGLNRTETRGGTIFPIPDDPAMYGRGYACHRPDRWGGGWRGGIGGAYSRILYHVKKELCKRGIKCIKTDPNRYGMITSYTDHCLMIGNGCGARMRNPHIAMDPRGDEDRFVKEYNEGKKVYLKIHRLQDLTGFENTDRKID